MASVSVVRDIYTEEQAIDKGKKGVTVLLTNNGYLYKNTKKKHAEEVMINDSQPSNITTIYIKNAPCNQCSWKLMNFYKDTSQKPIIHVGKIWREHNPEDDEGLVNLFMKGFEFQVWETFHYLKPLKKYKRVREYLDQIRERAEEEMAEVEDMLEKFLFE